MDSKSERLAKELDLVNLPHLARWARAGRYFEQESPREYLSGRLKMSAKMVPDDGDGRNVRIMVLATRVYNGEFD